MRETSSIDMPSFSRMDSSRSPLLYHSEYTFDTGKDAISRPSRLATFHYMLTSCLLLFAKMLLLVFSLYGLYTATLLPLYKRLSHPVPIVCNCGNSTAEAVSRGCKFDSLATSWLPPACRDDPLTEEFDRSGPGPSGEWFYYLHKNRSEVISVEQVAMLADNADMENRQFWMTSEWHTAHCLFYWRKSHRSIKKIQSGGKGPGAEKIEETFSDAIHVDHCAMEFLNRRDPEDISVLGFSGFGDPLEGFDPAEFLPPPRKIPSHSH